MSRAIGYTRLSQESDRSIAKQKEHIREYCDEHGFDLLEIYDDGERSSGFETESRGAYLQVREAMLNGEVDAVVVNDKRRLARDVDEVMTIIPQCRRNGVEIHSWQDGRMNLDDPMMAVIELVEAASEHKAKQKEIERAREAVADRMKNGYDHGRPRFGMVYNSDGTRQVPGENFDVVERVWEMKDSGCTYDEIVEATEVSRGTAHRLIQDRDWYDARVSE